jgi:hypothetical protein
MHKQRVHLIVGERELRRTGRVICPTGSFAKSLSSPLCKNISLRRLLEAALLIRHPVPQRGVAHVTDAGRDAVDALVLQDERRMKRTAKSCGPDAPTLASSFAEQSARRRWQTSPVTEESTK